MPLEWIFGSKKKSEQEHSTQDDSQAKRDDGEDDFVMLSQSMAQQSTLNVGGPYLPYSLAPATSIAQDKHQQHSINQQEQSAQQTFLHGVPFKLTCSASFEDVEDITTLHVRTTQQLALIKEFLSSNSFEYTFSLEDGVIRQ